MSITVITAIFNRVQGFYEATFKPCAGVTQSDYEPMLDQHFFAFFETPLYRLPGR